MNYWDLYSEYGDRNKDGYYIMDHVKWHRYAQMPEVYKSKKEKLGYGCLFR